jgi:hypothetical protein
MARCKPFDVKIRATLTALGFKIDDDGKGAEIISDEITIEIYQPEALGRDAAFWVTINLPNGTELFWQAKSRDLMDAAGIEADEPTQ